jgi:diguanylate cyclase (GGDEF)-like protein/PAS domain S-box-containing protein
MRTESSDLKPLNLVVAAVSETFAVEVADALQYEYRAMASAVAHEEELRHALTSPFYSQSSGTVVWTHGYSPLSTETALQIAQSLRPEWPFVLLAESIEGETAARLLRAGVIDIVSPNHLNRLGTVIRRELSSYEANQVRRRSEASLHEAEARYRTITESAFDLIAEFDTEGRFLYTSASYPLVSGHSDGELLGHSIFEHVHPDDRDRMVAEFTAALNGTRNGKTVCRWHHKNGEWRWFESTLREFRSSQGDRRVVQISRDVTAHKRHEDELESLITLAKAINSQTHISGIVKELWGHLGNLLPFDAIAIAFAREPDGDETREMKIVEYRGEGEKIETSNLLRSLQPTHTVWTSLGFGEVRRVNGWSGISPTFRVGTRAFLDVPLHVDGEALGVLHFASTQPFAFVEEHARLASMIGEQVAVAARQAQLFGEIRQAREKYRSLINDVNAIVWEIDPVDLHLTYMSPQVEEWLGYAPERLMYDRDLWLRLVHVDDREYTQTEAKRHIEVGEDYQIDYRVTTNDGRQLWLRNIASVETSEPDEQHRVRRRVRGVTINITDRKVAENSLRESNAVLRATQEASADGICLLDERGNIVSCNSRFREMWRIPDELARAQRGVMGLVLSGLREPGEFVDKINFLLEHPDASSRNEVHLKNGQVFERYSSPAVGEEGQNFGRIWVFTDVTERKQYEQQLAYQAFHDPLTNLPNRTLFIDRVNHAIAHLGRSGSTIAVLFLDLDRFKVINDSMGHEKGDWLLKEVASRLQSTMRPGDTAARFGGDEFTLLVESINGSDDAVAVAERILDALSQPFMLDERELYITTSIGIAVSATPTERADDLLRNSDIAMYRAKNKGKARYEVFDMKMSEAALERLQLEVELRQAVRWQQLRLDYQPLVDLESDEIVGVEALVRWQHPQRGLIPPGDFIPIAEESGMIVAIGQWVLREACTQARRWQIEMPTKPLRMSVNLSAKQFQQSNLIGDVEAVLNDTGLDPSLLELEITESAIMEDADSTIEQLEMLKKLGVKLAVDDFGTGYSSLAYIERFPLDVLKIDRSFVAQIGAARNGSGGQATGLKTGKNGEVSVVMQAVSNLGLGLGVRITAEGIETEEQLKHLRDLGCDIGQGFLFAKPLSSDDLVTLLRTRSAHAVTVA